MPLTATGQQSGVITRLFCSSSGVSAVRWPETPPRDLAGLLACFPIEVPAKDPETLNRGACPMQAVVFMPVISNSLQVLKLIRASFCCEYQYCVQ
jgi:hypothetical protein